MWQASNSSYILSPGWKQWCERAMVCMSSQILTEASSTETAPREGWPGVSTASVYVFFSPLLPHCLHCSHALATFHFLFFVSVLSLNVCSLCSFSSHFFVLLYPVIDFSTTVELRLQITGSERLCIPRDLKSVQLTVVPGNQTEVGFFFALTLVY